MALSNTFKAIINEEDYETLHRLAEWIDWDAIGKEQELSEDFIREFADYLNWDGWDGICLKQRGWSFEFMREFEDYIDWEMICRSPLYTTDEFIREFEDYIDWWLISHSASEAIIREYHDQLDWEELSACVHLPTSLICEFQDRVDWNLISIHQTIEPELVKQCGQYLDWQDMDDEGRLRFWMVIEYKQYIPKGASIIQELEETKEALSESIPLPSEILDRILAYV
jgi:hypothetical protein